MKTKAPETLLESYRQAAIRHRTALEEGNAKAANRAHDKVVKLSHHFRHGGSDLQEAFIVLLNDENLSVRAWAATHALEFAPDEAVRVLRKIARGPRSLIRLSAEMVLAQWEAGTLYLP
jgi:hypothetical protein